MCTPISCPLSQIVTRLLIDSKRTIQVYPGALEGRTKSLRYQPTAGA